CLGKIKALLTFAVMALLSAPATCAQPAAPLRLIDVIPLPDVRGRIDHFDVDLTHQRLFMSALGNDTLEVFDLRTNRPIHRISGLHEPQGVTYVPKSNRIFVANGDDGSVRVFDGGTYRLLNVVHFPSDADDSRYDPAINRVFVGYGGGSDAGLGILDGATGTLLGKIELPGHPESFQLEESGTRIFANIPTAGNKIAVISRSDRRIMAMWTLGEAEDNFPMALDEKDHRLFIGTRSPPEVLVLDTDSGKVIARAPSVGHADDMWYDPAHERIYVSGGSGFISVIQQSDPSHYRRLAQFKTLPGGRTSCFVPELSRLYLGVWGQGGRPELLQVYDVGS
ncbi:MAG TPA: YncE family protein, partial [Steroidobacteraceae bacterium]|nr:YncE family protein [Steroidobacteraceae bacterium]